MSDQAVTPVEPSEPASQLPERNPLPDVADILFLFTVILLVNVKPHFVLGDGSTGWHLATGKWILEHGRIPQTDLFSALYPDKPWVPYEWLSDVIAASLHAVGGLKLVAVATICALAWLFALMYLECRRAGCNFIVATVLTIIGALTSSIHWLARPHIFTFFGVFLMSRHLEKYRTGIESRKRLLITIAILMALWSNLHPAFLVGLALIVIYLVSEIATYVATAAAVRSASAERLKTFAMGLGIGFAATFVNPNATRMYGYIFHYLRQSMVLQNTQEYMAGNLREMHAICMLILMALFVVALMAARRPLGLAPVLTFLAFGYLGLNSMRNEPLFAIIAVPLIGTLFASFSLRKIFDRPYVPAAWIQRLREKMQPINENTDAVERTCTMHLLPIGLTALLAISCLFGGKFGPVEVVVSDWDPETKPIKTLACIEKEELDFRKGLNYDNWGGYLSYVTGKRVFIDDRLDFYGTQHFIDYATMIGLGAESKKTMERHGIEWIIFPTKSGLINALKRTPGWRVLCEDEAATVMVMTAK
jgi:hypothetical protein